ncbi:Cytosolic neutral trehalase [Nakaseomyces bracarensis]|uniref:Endonuclease III homolog n=1 Tax=Nakaseomyces bracarensis TaxID=273131 RepID=A0ABR4NZM6_9SACH
MSRKRGRKYLEVSVDGGPVTSKYFKRETDNITVETTEKVVKYEDFVDEVDIEWVKTLDNFEYFEWIDERTSEDPRRWLTPLDEMSVGLSPKEIINLPPNFFNIYNRVRAIRGRLKTPVDSVGCALMPIYIAKHTGRSKEQIKPINYRFQLLIAVMLSSQTKDEITALAMLNMMKHCIEVNKDPDGMTLDSMLKLSEPTIDELIKSVGFHRRKASYIHKSLRLLRDNFQSDVPTNVGDMLTLPGVGPKMTYLALQRAWGKMDGICVDVHVDRLCKMWKWVDPIKCKTPDHTRKELQTWLPKCLWYEINSVLVGFGQVICMARGRRCDICFANDICNAKDRKLSSRLDDPLKIDEGFKTLGKTTRGEFEEYKRFLMKRAEDDLLIKTEY